MKRPSRFKFKLTSDKPDGRVRSFNSLVSCRHEWEPNVRADLDGEFNVVAKIEPGERCMLCEATCKRDPQGRIVEYSTKASREVEEAAALEAVDDAEAA